MRAYVARSFNEGKITQELAAEGSTYFVAESQDAIAGYARTATGDVPPGVTGERPIELVRLYVDQPFHGTGLAHRLLQACIDDAKAHGHDSMHLGVWERNPRAQAFYDKWGFRKVGEQRFDLGGDIQTDWVMELAL
jgi:ribosomal protein S18 acetylase RimI-like enzyme